MRHPGLESPPMRNSSHTTTPGTEPTVYGITHQDWTMKEWNCCPNCCSLRERSASQQRRPWGIYTSTVWETESSHCLTLHQYFHFKTFSWRRSPAVEVAPCLTQWTAYLDDRACFSEWSETETDEREDGKLRHFCVRWRDTYSSSLYLLNCHCWSI